MHEAWLTDDEIIFTHWPHALKAIQRDGTGERTVGAFNCWHPAPRRDGGLIVCDTTLPDVGLQLVEPATGSRRPLCYPRASSQGHQWKEPEPVWEGPVPGGRLRAPVDAPAPVLHAGRAGRRLHLGRVGPPAGLPRLAAPPRRRSEHRAPSAAWRVE